VGNSIALPGSDVDSITFSTSSIRIQTNLGVTLFSNVDYETDGTMPNGYTVGTDPSGLQRITFATVTVATFQQGATGTVGTSPEYIWSNSANWASGIMPSDGSQVTFDVSGSTPSTPGGYDDFSSLYLDKLTLPKGYLAVGGSLTISNLLVGESGIRGIEADTLANGGTASVTIDALSFGGAYVGAEGANAVTSLDATSTRARSITRPTAAWWCFRRPPTRRRSCC